MSKPNARAAPAAGRVVSLALLALLTLGALLALDRLYHAPMFRIAAVEIHGLHSRPARVDGEQVRAVVTSALPATYFSVELAAIEARIEQLPWVFSASLRRKWPDALIVEVTEVQPVAQWGDARWLHSTGDLVARPADADTVDDAAWRDLPRLSGPGDRAHAAVWRAYQTWSKAFAAKGLHLDELHIDARGLCYLQLSVSALAERGRAGPGHESAIRLVVPRRDADARIARFTRALRAPQLGDLAALRTVDLRYPNGFAVSRAPAPPANRATVAATTTPTHAEAH